MTITEMERDNRAPNSSGLVVLRVVMLLIAFFSSIKESIQVKYVGNKGMIKLHYQTVLPTVICAIPVIFSLIANTHTYRTCCGEVDIF